MKILQLSTYDRAGGAEKVAFDLHQAYRKLGHDARLLVRYKRTDAPHVIEADPYAFTSPWASLTEALDQHIAHQKTFRGQYRLRDWLQRTAWPQRWLDTWHGVENFNYPYSYSILDEDGWRPDVIHAHNLHGDYFDLRALAPLSHQTLFTWTLHDTWALTGHCGYFIDCERWREGCGHCPDLKRAPAIRQDRTAENWQRKQRIYTQSRLAVVTPSRWLMEHVEHSMLQPARRRVIPNGVDITVYRPGIRQRARAVLGLSQTAFICMFIAYSASTTNIYKDVTTIDRAVRSVAAQRPDSELQCVCVGANDRGSAPDASFHYTGYLDDPEQIVLYYQAANVLLHAANAENFPCVILEALACGTPIIATAVGGIPEQIVEESTGFLVPRGDSDVMAGRLAQLIDHPDQCEKMGLAAALHAQQNFSLERQVANYLQWFEECWEDFRF